MRLILMQMRSMMKVRGSYEAAEVNVSCNSSWNISWDNKDDSQLK